MRGWCKSEFSFSSSVREGRNGQMSPSSVKILYYNNSFLKTFFFAQNVKLCMIYMIIRSITFRTCELSFIFYSPLKNQSQNENTFTFTLNENLNTLSSCNNIWRAWLCGCLALIDLREQYVACAHWTELWLTEDGKQRANGGHSPSSWWT